jgi:hypothetical protein
MINPQDAGVALEQIVVNLELRGEIRRQRHPGNYLEQKGAILISVVRYPGLIPTDKATL